MSEPNTRPLGDRLRQRREELGIAPEQAQADTKIRERYLHALEQEEFGSLPDSVVGRGFLRNYATYLGLDSTGLVKLYNERVAAPEAPALPTKEANPFTEGVFEPVALHKIPSRRSRRLWMSAFVLVLVAGLAFLAWWQYPRIMAAWSWGGRTSTPAPTQPAERADATRQAATSTSTVTSSPSSLPQSPTPTGTGKPTEGVTPPTRLPSQSPTTVVYTGIFLELTFTDTSWIQVTVDGVRQFQGELPSGTYKSWYGVNRIELRLGNAGAVIVTVNGQNLGPLGAVGDVVDQVFEMVGGEVSTATPASTPSRTPSRTPRPSTPTPTATRPSATPPPTPATPIP